MAGLLQQQPGQAQQAQTGGMRDATGEEQQQYEQAYQYLERLVTEPEAFEQYAQVLSEAKSVPNGIAAVGAQILVRMEVKLGLDDAVKAQLIEDILAEVIEIAEEMGLIDESQITEKLMKTIVGRGAEEYARIREQVGKPITPQEEAQNLEQAEEEGALAEGINAMSNDEAAKMKKLLGMIKQGQGGANG